MRAQRQIDEDIRVADQAIENVSIAIAGARYALAAATRQMDTEETEAILKDADELPVLAVSLQLWRLALECERIEREGGTLTIAARDARARLERAERERGIAEGAVRCVLLSALESPMAVTPLDQTDECARDAFLDVLREHGGYQNRACMVLGIPVHVLRKWRASDSDFDEAFKNIIEESKRQRAVNFWKARSGNGTGAKRGRPRKEQGVSA